MTNKQIIRLTESDLHRIIRESVNSILKEDLSWIDKCVNDTWNRVNKSKLKPILDNLGLARGKGGFSIGGDYNYDSIKLYNPRVEIRAYYNGDVYMFFGYNDNVGAWGGFTKKYEVTDPDIFKTSKWKQIIKNGGVDTSPDVIMMP